MAWCLAITCGFRRIKLSAIIDGAATWNEKKFCATFLKKGKAWIGDLMKLECGFFIVNTRRLKISGKNKRKKKRINLGFITDHGYFEVLKFTKATQLKTL